MRISLGHQSQVVQQVPLVVGLGLALFGLDLVHA